MSEIADFLNAQYDRIEEKARAACVRAATWGVSGTWHLEGVEHSVVGEEEAFCHPHNVEHLALHDPAYVLVDIASKRRIMTEIVELIDSMDAQLECEFGTGSSDRADESEKLLHLLAAPFSAEPGYDEKWAV